MGGGGGGARPDLWPDADANAEANVTFDDVGVDAKMGNVGWTPWRTVMGIVSDDVTIIATGADLKLIKNFFNVLSLFLKRANRADKGDGLLPTLASFL